MSTRTIFLGKAAEHLFVSRLMANEIECYLPVSGGGRVDVVVGNRLSRCQIKTIQYQSRGTGLPLRKCGGTHPKVYRYTKEDIDFFVGADLSTMDIYVVPIEVTCQYRANISLKVMNEMGFKNNFSCFG